MVKITLQPECLKWARERAGFSVPELASKLQVNEDKLLSWEQTGEISLSLAERLAAATRIPFGYLFLPKPIVEELPIKDFRTVQSQDIPRPSIDLLDVVNDALQRQDWYRDYVLASGGELLEFVGQLSPTDNILESADRIRSVVTWSSSLSVESPSWEDALSRRIDTVEDAGILVMRSGIVGNNTHRPLSVSEFRGFALSDKYAPLIFINSKDAKAAQMFTLAHELVHIWLGVSGVSNLKRTYSPDIDIERFCNAVAAELLIPSDDLRSLWKSIPVGSDIVGMISRHFKVSSLVALRRLRDASFISEEEFQQRYTEELKQFKQRTSVGEGGDFYRTLRARLGKRFASALVDSTLEGGTTYREAFQLLGVNKADTVHEFARKIGTAT